MTKIEEVIEALEAVSEDRRDDLAEAVLIFITNALAPPGESAMTEEQQEVVRQRIARGFVAADPADVEAVFARYT